MITPVDAVFVSTNFSAMRCCTLVVVEINAMRSRILREHCRAGGEHHVMLNRALACALKSISSR
jgi:hypothetical protein